MRRVRERGMALRSIARAQRVLNSRAAIGTETPERSISNWAYTLKSTREDTPGLRWLIGLSR